MGKNAFKATVAMLLVGVFVTACNSNSSSASSGVTQAQLAAAIASATAPLQAEITTLQSQVSSLQTQQSSTTNKLAGLYLTISAPNAPVPKAARGLTMAPNASTSTTSCTGLGTLTGDGLPGSDTLHGISCSGYRFSMTACASGQTCHYKQLSNGVLVGYDGTNCTGNAYVQPGNSFYSAAVSSGVMFVLDPTVGPGGTPDYTNSANYLYVPAAESPASYVEASYFLYGTGCQAAAGSTLSGYPALPNDPNVTKEGSGTIAGPVGPGQA